LDDEPFRDFTQKYHEKKVFISYLFYNPMPLKKHHKWIIGGASSIIILFMVVIGILLNGVMVKQSIDYKNLNNKISELQADTQNKLNELTESLLQTKTTLEESQEEISLLKASAGEDFSGIIENAIKGVVTIRTEVAQGTGFLITDNGYIVTNAHVLVGGQSVTAITNELDMISADFIGYDGTLDIALLKISGDYESLKLGDSDKVQIGEKVIAIGNPLGLQFSVSQGIISGVHRDVINGIPAYIQTDAALNPGNSGGPLINQEGRVIGINNFKIGSSESLGFALESNYIKYAVNEISQSILNQTLIE